ncbi:MAG TPA: exonuclease domain-containing protein [Candidatus Woesebacteria bacterium]|nr:exonuclease domain-containing protein [Candidatus Woesebacteria bacterium]
MNLSFVDIETTGAHARYDRIIEIGILRVENNMLTKTYQKLINPETYLNPFISQMTGISTSDLEKAPTFEEIKEEILEVLDGTIFVAHNVRFDYGFLRNEFKRFGINYSSKQMCTVKLSRTLFPQYTRHSLDTLIDRFQFDMENRHRAFDDAKILWDFFQKVHTLFPIETVERVVNEIIKKPALPQHLSQDILDNLPEGPGVYIFYGEGNIPLYIGKSVTIRDRVLSHFTNDQNSSKELKISQQIVRIETIPTVGEFGALLKEAELIKTMQPLYNTQLRRTHKVVLLKRKELPNRFYSLEMEQVKQITPDDISTMLGIFPSKKKAKEYIKKKAEEHELCEKLLGLEKGSGSCFGHKIERCKGACINKEHFLSYNMRFIQAFSEKKIKSWPFEGAIKITEVDPIEHKREEFIANRWCLTSAERQELFFDYDTYKILVRYIFNRRNQAYISPMKESLHTMQSVS